VDGTEDRIINEDCCSNINVVGDWIYYTSNDITRNDAVKWKLYKVRTDGTDFQVLVDVNRAVMEVIRQREEGKMRYENGKTGSLWDEQ
jgi:hypothetical protein